MAETSRMFEELNDGREQAAVREMFRIADPLLAPLFSPLNINWPFSWVIIEARLPGLVADARGEIDILAGNLAWRVPPPPELAQLGFLGLLRHACEGGLAWPPPMDHLAGIEVKLALLKPDAQREYLASLMRHGTGSGRRRLTLHDMRSAKTGKNRRLAFQLRRMISLGLDRGALLDLVYSGGASAPLDGGAWLLTADASIETHRAMRPIVRRRPIRGACLGHIVGAWGGISGRPPADCGGIRFSTIRLPKDNPQLHHDAKVRTSRHELSARLGQRLSGVQRPTQFPLRFVDCIRCGDIHWIDADC